VTRTLNLRVLPQVGAFDELTWVTGSSTCGNVVATVSPNTNTTNIPTVSFNDAGPLFSATAAHAVLRYAFTPGCRGAVVMGPAAAQNAGWPMSIFNFGFDNVIADAPGSRFNLGTAAWNHNHFQASIDGSYVIAVAEGSDFSAGLWNMLDLARIGAHHTYLLTGTLSASVALEQVHVIPSTSNDWYWTLP
jgi:hypothetical protein